MSRLTLVLAVLMVVWTTVGVVAAAEDAATDLPKLQGKWELEFAPATPGPNGSVKAVREIVGNTETVTYLDKEGKTVYAHGVEFELRDAGPVRMFIFFNGRIMVGAGAGRKQEGRSGYPYRLDGDVFYEVRGITSGTAAGTAPHVVAWKRVKG